MYNVKAIRNLNELLKRVIKFDFDITTKKMAVIHVPQGSKHKMKA